MRDIVENERGAAALFIALAVVIVLLTVGLAVDAGRGYILKAELSRAVDAAALGGARTLRSGRPAAERRARVLAGANGVGGTTSPVQVGFARNAFGEETVTVQANAVLPTLIMRLLGQNTVSVRSAAVAAVPPVDLVLVIDQSGSLGMANAWEDLQDAGVEFVSNFNDEIDQVGLASFNLRGTNRVDLKKPFTQDVIREIQGMRSTSYTNAGEGLRMAHEQFQSDAVRERAVRAVVFFTDGQPTAFRGIVDGRDRVLAAWQGSTVAGYWNNPESINMDSPRGPDGCRRVTWCYGYSLSGVHSQARQNGLDWADQIRAQGTIIYTIGLGDMSQPPGSILQPDQGYLRRIANEGGVSDPDQPRGRMYFAPTSRQLREVFRMVAEDLLARLTV
jgi:Flp pilus assembly protein TadG